MRNRPSHIKIGGKTYKRVTNHTLLALNPKTQFGLPGP